jgi:hypothetical protein
MRRVDAAIGDAIDGAHRRRAPRPYATDADDATTIEIDAADIALSSDDGWTRADV